MKIIIQNRKEQKIIVLVEVADEQKGLAFVMHGLGGNKDQAHIGLIARSFYEHGYTAVRFDATNTFGESDGSYEDATTTNYYEDLEDVIAWASKQEWYEEPFCLSGHSLGGISVLLYAEQYPEKVKALAPHATVVSGFLSFSSEKYSEDIMKQWEELGYYESLRSDGGVKRLKWNHAVDRKKYNALDRANKLTMPVLMVVGTEDKGTPLEHQKLLFDRLPGKKELRIVDGAPHAFSDPEHLEALKSFFDAWLESLV